MGIPKLVIRYGHAGTKHTVVAEDAGRLAGYYPILRIRVYRKRYTSTEGQLLFRQDTTWEYSASIAPWIYLWAFNGVKKKLLDYYMYWYSPNRDLQFRRNA